MFKSQLKEILDRFSRDGSHPDYPVQKVYDREELGKIGGSNLPLDLPALVVYEQKEDGKMPHIGIVFALANSVDGVRIQVISEYEGEVMCHAAEESPSGNKPAYLLMKKHLMMKNVP